MERNTTAQKILFFLLDMLLIIGAIVGVLTIDRGRWIISNPAFYQSPGETPQENTFVPNTQTNGSEDTGAKIIPQTGATCLTEAQIASPQGYENDLLLNAYYSASPEKDSHNGVAVPLTVCGK
jgi:hypothetical protein